MPPIDASRCHGQQILLNHHIALCVCSRSAAAHSIPSRGHSCAGEVADNLVIQEAATEVAEDVILDVGDDDSEDEEEAHGLEDLGNAFQGPLNETQEKYKAKLEAKLKQVRAAAANAIIGRSV